MCHCACFLLRLFAEEGLCKNVIFFCRQEIQPVPCSSHGHVDESLVDSGHSADALSCAKSLVGLVPKYAARSCGRWQFGPRFPLVNVWVATENVPSSGSQRLRSPLTAWEGGRTH